MPTVRYGEFLSELSAGESALDALLRSGAPVAYSCKSGVCGSCMLRAVEGEVPSAAQSGLKDAWKARGYFLACVCRPECDLTVAGVGGDAEVKARIVAIDSLSADVLRVRIECAAPFEFRAGQYITLRRDDGLARSYSIASLPREGRLELHIRCLPKGRMSEWIRGLAGSGTGEPEGGVSIPVHIMGPSGECFYVAGRPEQPIILAGTGTGLAPLYGVLRDALEHGHTGPIHLFHGALREEGLYLREELAALAGAHANVEYVPSLLASDGPLDQVVLKRFPKLAGRRAFLCGDPALVQGLRKKLFLQGLDLREIHADAFVPAA